MANGSEIGGEDELDWRVGEVRRAVLKKNEEKGYNNLITYAPDGKVVILFNESGEDIGVNDLVEVYITEEKPRSYYGKILEVIKSYGDIKEMARYRQESFDEHLDALIRSDFVVANVSGRVKELSNDVSDLRRLLKSLREDIAESPESEDGERIERVTGG